MGAMGALLIAGYVLLAAIGRDTTAYVLFLGGPAMTTIIGAVISRKIGHVQAQVKTVQTAAAVALDEEAGAIHQHLNAQDHQLEQLAQAVTDVVPAPPAPVAGPAPAGDAAGPGLPSPRSREGFSGAWPILGHGRTKGV